MLSFQVLGSFGFFLPLWWCLVLVLVRLFKGRGALGGERGHHRTQGSSPSYWPVLSSSLPPLVSAAHWRLRQEGKGSVLGMASEGQEQLAPEA